MEEPAENESLGPKIRRLRQQQQWNLSELGERCGIAPSTLSKVENDLQSLSYDRLVSVANAFGMSCSEFLAGAGESAGSSTRPQTNGRLTVERRGNHTRIDTENCGYEYMCTRIRHKSITPLMVEIKCRSIEEFGELIRHEGEEFIYVVEGAVELHTDFYGPEVLQAGDCAYIDSEMGHACIAISEEPAWIVNTMTSVQHIAHDAGDEEA